MVQLLALIVLFLGAEKRNSLDKAVSWDSQKKRLESAYIYFLPIDGKLLEKFMFV